MARLNAYGPVGDVENTSKYSAGESHTGLPGDYSLHFRRMANDQTDRRYDVSGVGATTAVTKRATWRRGWIRIDRLPTVETGIWFNSGTVNPGSAALLLTVKPDGWLSLYSKGTGTFPGEFLGTPGKIMRRTWHKIQIACTFTTAWPANDSLAELGLDGTFIRGTATINQGIGVVQLGSRDVLGRLESDAPWLDIEYSNWVVDDADYPPDDTRISAVKVAAAGTFQQWTGGGIADWRARNTWPGIGATSAGGTTGIRTTTAAQKQTYLMESFAAAGITGTIYGATAHVYFALAPAAIPDLIVIRNGVEVDTALWLPNPSFYLSYRLDVTGWALTDTIELGIRNNVATGGTARVGSIVLSVEHDTPLPPIAPAVTAADEVSWTGNDVAVTVALPFEPTWIAWWPRTANASGGFWSAEANVQQHVSRPGAGDPNFMVRGTSLHVVGAEVNGPNSNGVVYDALLISDPQMRMLAAGAYAQVNAAGRDDLAIPITTPLGVPFAPEALIAVKEETNTIGYFRYAGPGFAVGDSASLLAGAPGADFIQALTATGFTAGLSLHNQIQQTSYVGFRRTALTTTFLMDVFSYVGNGAGGTRVVSARLGGLTGAWAIVVPVSAATRAIFNTHQAGGKQLLGGGGALANSIVSLGTDSMTVGTGLNANGVTYSVLIFALGTDPGPVIPCTGGGTVISGINPSGSPPSLATATTPLLWVECSRLAPYVASVPPRVSMLREPRLPIDVTQALAGRVRWLRRAVDALDAELSIAYPPVEIVPVLWTHTLRDGAFGMTLGRVRARSYGWPVPRFGFQLTAAGLLALDEDYLRGMLAHEFLHVVHLTLGTVWRHPLESPGCTWSDSPAGRDYDKSREDYHRIDADWQTLAPRWLSPRLQRLFAQYQANPPRAALQRMYEYWIERGLPVEPVTLTYRQPNPVAIDLAIVRRAAQLRR